MKYQFLRRINQVIIPKSFRYVFRSLTDEQAGQLIKAVFETWASKAKAPKAPKDPELLEDFEEIMREMDMSALAYLRKGGRDFDEWEDREDE